MMANLKPYPTMKDSGIEWLGNVPEHWKVIPVAAIARQKSVTNQQDRELLSVYLNLGVIRFSDINEKRTNVTSDDLSKYQAVDPGDFVLNNQQAWRGSVGVSKHKGIVSPAYLVLSLNSSINPEYANLLFRDRSMVGQYVVCSKGVGSIQRNLYWPHLKRVSTVLPPLPEQAAIVKFLDHSDRRIRRYISAKEKLIKLLNEQKQAIIHRAVTRGLDPKVHLKPSGVEWLGDIPAHWVVKPLKRWVKINAKTLTNKTANDFEFRYLDIETVGTGRLTREPERIKFGDAPSRARRIVCSGDTIISTVRTYLKAIYFIDDMSEPTIASTGFAVLTPTKAIVPKYLSFLVQSANFIDRVAANSVGTAYPAINEKRMGTFHLAAPDISEQEKILTYIEAATAPFESALSVAHAEAELIREYRTQLIANVVTGKLDVREAISRIPEEIEELELTSEEGIADLEWDRVNDFEEELEETVI